MEAIIGEILQRFGVPGALCVIVFFALKRIIDLERKKTKLERDGQISKINARLDLHDKQLERGNSRFSMMEGTLNDIRIGIGKIETAMEFIKDKVK
jgi:hypothetical protein